MPTPVAKVTRTAKKAARLQFERPDVGAVNYYWNADEWADRPHSSRWYPA